MNAVAFIGALALAVAALEAGTAILGLVKRDKLQGAVVKGGGTKRGRSSWEALLVAIFPGRFDPDRAAANAGVIELLQRAGYPYDTPGEFSVAAIRFFTVYLVAGAFTAGVLYMLGLGVAAPFLVAAFIYMGLTRPYAYLRSLARKRAEALRNNMLVGLALLESLLISGLGLQEAMKQASALLGGPFCNLMKLLGALMSGKHSASEAIEITRAHIPDPDDVDMQLFLRDVSDYFSKQRSLAEGISALRASVHRNILEATERRAAVVLQRTSILGIFSVVGLILSIILPFMSM